MITDEMTEEQMEQAMRNAHAFELKIRKALLESIAMDLREFGMEDAAGVIEENYPS